MNYIIAKDFPHGILSDNTDPKVTLYVPTSREANANEAFKIRIGNLIRTIEKKLEKVTDKDIKERIISSLKIIKDDRTLWNQRLEGFCIFANANQTVVYILQNPVREMAIVGQRFHQKPLIKDLQGLDEYQILALDRHAYSLYEGNRTGFREIPLGEDEPQTIQDFLGDEYTESYLSQGSYGGAASKAMFHGHKSKKDEVDKDIERYLRLVDQHVMKHYSNVSKKPLILFALPEYHTIFRKHSHNPHLLDEGIKQSPHELKLDALKELAWNIIEPRYESHIDTLTETYRQAKQKGSADHKIHTVAKAAVSGRVDTILIEAYREIPGRIDTDSGRVIDRNNALEKFEDALDDLTDIVINNGGKVHVIPEDKMPTDTGIAAIYRY